MNSLEKYAAKKRLTEQLMLRLLGEKPGVGNLMSQIGFGGSVGGLAGSLGGKGLDAGAHKLLSHPRATGTLAEVFRGMTESKGLLGRAGVLEEMGASIGSGLGSIRGARNWMKVRDAYEKKKMLAAGGAAVTGGAGLAGLLSLAGS